MGSIPIVSTYRLDATPMGVTVRVRVVMQSRTDSARFPAKSLVSIAGYPLVVLAAKRAANRGHDVVVATSSRAIDDGLAAQVESHDLRVLRGSYANVRQRVLSAVCDMDDSDIVVRLTADNPAPDGNLINLVVDDFLRSDLDHIETSGHTRFLPYGMSVEVCRVGSLRDSCEWRDTPDDREHVTLALRELGRSHSSSVRSMFGDVGNLRCTIDTFEDWFQLSAIFGSFRNPIEASWEEVIARLQTAQFVNSFQPHRRPILGTAQLAQPYGSVIPVRPPQASEAIEMLRRAVLNGFWIDTARSYGQAEKIIGDAFRNWTGAFPRIITKCNVPQEVQTAREIVAAVRTEVDESSRLLGLEQLAVVLIHDPNLLDKFDGEVVQSLVRLRNDGRIERVGVSIDGPERLLSALENPHIQVIQLAFNLLDYRWSSPAVARALRNRPDVEIHCRSIFLQGVLLREAPAWPKIPEVKSEEVVLRLRSLVTELNRHNLVDLCLAWVLGANSLSDHLTGVVVGAESLEQLDELIEASKTRGLTETEVRRVTTVFADLPERLLNPAQWPPLSNN